jgi:hypothetical protein
MKLKLTVDPDGCVVWQHDTELRRDEGGVVYDAKCQDRGVNLNLGILVALDMSDAQDAEEIKRTLDRGGAVTMTLEVQK